MIEIEKKEVEKLSSEILHQYFCENDVKLLVSKLSDDVVWLGAGEKQKAEGKEEVSRIFLEGKESGELIRNRMWGEEYVTTYLAEGCYLCEGISWLESVDPKASMRLQQRNTFIFRKEEGRWKIAHIHNSIPFNPINPGELFPMEEAVKTHQKLKRIIGDRDRQIELMLSQLPGGNIICYTDKNYREKWIGQSLYEMLGYGSMEEYEQRSKGYYSNNIYKEDYEMVVQRMENLMEENGTYSIRYRVLKKDGSLLWVLDIGKKYMDEEGESVLSCFIADISEDIERERTLAKANEEAARQAKFLESLYDTVLCGIMQFTVKEPYTIINANRMAEEIFGYSKQDYQKGNISALDTFEEKNLAEIKPLLRKLGEDGGRVSYERKAIRKDGSYCWISVFMERLERLDGQPIIQAVFNDITKIKKLQEEKEQAKLIENKSLLAAIYTTYDKIVLGNLTKNTYEILGAYHNRKNPSGKVCFDEQFQKDLEKIHPAYQENFKRQFIRSTLIEQFQNGQNEIYDELQQMDEDGNYHWIGVHTIGIDNPYNDDILEITMIRELDQQMAEKKKQEQLLRDALKAAEEANEAKSQFLSRMSHDIRTPMNAIIGMSTIGQMYSDKKQKVEDCFQKIDFSSQYLLSLIDDVLDMSRIESGKMKIRQKEFDFYKLMDQMEGMISSQAEEQGIHFCIKYDQVQRQHYIGDELRLNQVLMNLISNALKFTPSGGDVLVTAKECFQEENHVTIQFSIKDTGIGISKEFLPKIYEPFEQEDAGSARNRVGSGLGLSIVRNLVQLMGGTIEVQSAKGKGTQFFVTVPLQVSDKTKTIYPKKITATAIENSGRHKGKRILLVEDNELNQEIAKALLEEQGMIVDTAGDGEIAVRMFKDHEPLWYQMIFMDIRMPKMDGLKACTLIRESRKEDARTIPMIAMSANAFDEDKEEALLAGMNEYLVKPIDIRKLCEVLDRYLL